MRHVAWQRHMLSVGLLLKNGDLGFEIGRLNVCDQAPFETTAQPVLDLREFLGRTIAGDNNLLHRLMQCVESMEELFLRPFLLCEELDVVDKKDVDGTELV